MKKRKMNKAHCNSLLKISLIVCLFIFAFSSANASKKDPYKASASLSAVQADGFYRIVITPEMISLVKKDYSDIRMLDKDNKEVPYVITSEVASSMKELFQSYPIIINKSVDKQITNVTIHNQKKDTILKIQLLIKNADVRKEVSLFGSNDQKNWYVIKDKYFLHSLYHNENTMITETMSFPPSDYEYLKFIINDSISPPVQVVDAGYYNYVTEKGKYQSIAVQHMHQVDSSDGKSYIRMVFNGRQLLDIIQFDFSGAEYFYRPVSLARLKSKQIKKRDREYYFDPISYRNISSKQNNRWSFNALEADTLYLIIDNADNQPLKFEGANCYQLMHYINAHLKKDESYRMVFGNKKAKMPNYDLKYFLDSIPDNAALVTIQNIKREKFSQTALTSFGPGKIWIWIILGAVLLLLLFMSKKMLTEMKEKG